MLDDTIVIWTTEFGRMPCSQGGKGRDHNPFAFTSWLAGGGINGGISYGASDEWSYKAVENPTYCYDLHATVLHLLGIDHDAADLPPQRHRPPLDRRPRPRDPRDPGVSGPEGSFLFVPCVARFSTPATTKRPMTAPRFAAALSTLADTRTAAVEACELAKRALGDDVNLAIIFASFGHQAEFDALAEIADVELAADCLIGCAGESIVCNGREIEQAPALAVWLANLPGVALLPMHLEFQRTPDGGSFSGWPAALEADWPAGASMIVLGEPYSFPADVLLARLDQDHPGVPLSGGMASGGWGVGQNRLLLGSRALDSGAVAVLMHGPLSLANVVSQGCRPIGHTLVVTKAEQNVIFELGGKPALVQLQELFDGLTADEQQLARRGLHVGQVVDEYRGAFGRGDFLVRNVQGVDPNTGAIAIGDYVRVGQTVQFHVRDAQTADEDLNALVAGVKTDVAADSAGALLFTCNGRGTRLFDQPHHDAATLARHWPGVPVAGFFAQGEIGPIGRKNFLHGFTASIALFGPA